MCMLILVGCNNSTEHLVIYKLNYTAAEGGQIAGLTEQEIEEGVNGEIVTAVANDGYVFKQWSDGLTTAHRQEEKVKSDQTFTAYFEASNAEPVYFMLTYTAGEGGHIAGETEQTVVERTNGTPVTAIADEGFKFVKWSDGVKAEQRKDKYVISNKSVIAEFAPIDYYTLTYIADEGGHIEGETGQTIPEQTNGTLVTAVADDGYKFVKWSDGLKTEQRQDKAVDQSKTITAYFDRIPIYTLTYSANNSDYGYIQGEATQNVVKGGDSKTVTAMSKMEGWEFYRWSDGLKTPSRSEQNVTEDKEIIAFFWASVFTYEYTVAYAETGRIEGEAVQRVKRGDSGVEVTAVPNEGYFFSGWSDGLKTPTRVDSKQYCLNLTAYFVKGLEINYRVNGDIGGHIEGAVKQYVKKDGDTIAVKAVADDGYEFAGWSDCTVGAERSEKNVQVDFTTTAYFEPKEKIFRYDYCGATSNADIKTVTVRRDAPKASTFVVPQKSGYDFVGWYADDNYTTRVTDEDGGLMYGYNTVTLETDTLYARWSDPNDDTIVFKLLVVVVDEIDATLKLREDFRQTKHVHHKIPMPERILCKQIAGRMSAYLNEWFAGKVRFEIDTYFTTQAVDTEDFYHRNDNLDPQRMKEVKYLYDRYDSLLTFFDLNDYANEFKEPGVQGLGSSKRGCVYLEDFMRHVFTNKTIAEKVMQGDASVENRWKWIIETALHEFTHTVECRYGFGELYEYDDAIRDLYYDGIHDFFEITRRYLLCEAVIDGEIVGIPPEFWLEEVWKEKA